MGWFYVREWKREIVRQARSKRPPFKQFFARPRCDLSQRDSTNQMVHAEVMRLFVMREAMPTNKTKDESLTAS
eukprot:scaffold1793_cov163-Alexandrium_tamarense.AAC.6